jgi:hypothetical protein
MMDYKKEWQRLEMEIKIQRQLAAEASDPFVKAQAKLLMKKRELEDQLLEEIGKEDAWVSREWDCDKSPIGWCIMDWEDDWGEPCCVYCGDAEERK